MVGQEYMDIKGKRGLPDDNPQPSFPKHHVKERVGYPTQKPRELLERIIKASSKRRRHGFGSLLWLFYDLCGG